MAPSATEISQKYDLNNNQQQSCAWKKESLKSNPFHHVYNGKEIGRALVKHTLQQRVQAVDTNVCEPGQEDAFFVADLGEVYRQHLRWKLKLKRVKPHYGALPIRIKGCCNANGCSCQVQPRP